MPFEDLFRAQLDRERDPLDLLTEGQPDISPTRVAYRLGFRAGFVDGFPDPVRIGRVEIHYTVGPVLTQRTEIRQRAGTELIFDKHMERPIEVGRGHWLSICQIEADVPDNVSAAMLSWHDEARSAIGLLASILDERVALEQLFEDLIFLDDRGPITAGDMRARVRHFLPYRVADEELTALAALADEDASEQSPAARAARWYLRAAQQGPSADAIVALWIAVETLTPTRSTSPKAIESALTEVGWDITSQDLSVGRLAGLRAEIVHHGVENEELIKAGYYHLEAITRVLLRRELRIISTWPPQTSVNWIVDPPTDEIDRRWANPQTVWHDAGLPEPDASASVGETQWHPPLIPPEDEEPPQVTLLGEDVDDFDARRIRYWVKEAVRAMDGALAEVTILVEAGMPGDVAANAERVKLSRDLLTQPNALREFRLGWLLQAAVAQHLLMREGVPSDGGLGSMLIEVVGAWAQHREFVAGDGPLEDEDLTVQEPDPVSPDVFILGGHLGAAVAGSARAREILERWMQAAGDAQAVALIEGLQRELPAVRSPRELVAAVTAIYESAKQ